MALSIAHGVPFLDPPTTRMRVLQQRAIRGGWQLCAAIFEHDVDKPISISAWAEKAGILRQTLTGYLPDMRAKGLIATVGEGNNARQYLTAKGVNAARSWQDS
jgi:hypothetical protein